MKSPPPSPPPPPRRWQAVLLPLVAGILHLRVFLRAFFTCVLRHHYYFAPSSLPTTITTDEFLRDIFLLDRAVFVAYVFDLACCALRVVPFSRCNRSKDIVGHHLPTLLLALPLAVPLWSGMRGWEAASFSILDDGDHLDDGGGGDGVRARFVDAYVLASGFAYVSSLNEVFMCFQRAEMSSQGVDDFRDIGTMKRRVFTSRVAVYAELCYKLCFFWGVSVLACKACCDFDGSLYAGIVARTDYDGSVWRTLATVYSSPAVLRGALFRAFSIVMYPSMGMRCLKTLKRFRREGEVAKAA